MRELGYYWIKYEGCLWVAEWNGTAWYLPGIHDKKTDNQIDFVYETRITEPESN